MSADYEKLYHYLFNRITDALGELDAGRVDTARTVLAAAQIRTEESFGKCPKMIQVRYKPILE